MKAKTTELLAVASINTLQVYQDEFYVGIDCKNGKDFSILFTPAQITEMYNYLIERTTEISKNN